MRARKICLLYSGLSILLTTVVTARPVPPIPQGYVYTEGTFVEPEEATRLDTMLAWFTASTGKRIYLVLLSGLQGDAPAAVAEQLHKQWKLETMQGPYACILITVWERKQDIYVSKSWGLTPQQQQALVASVQAQVAAGYFAAALDLAAIQLMRTVGYSPALPQSSVTRQIDETPFWVWMLAALLLPVLAYVFRRSWPRR